MSCWEAKMEDWRLLAVAGLGVVMAATVVVVSSSMTVVDLFVLGLGCVSSGCGARLVQGRYLQWRRKSGGGARSATAGDSCAIRALRLLVGCLVVTAVLVLSKRRSELPDGLLELLWFVLTAAVTSVGLAAAFELCGTSKPELADALSEKQISFSEGAAWLFFLGYLEVIFGEHGKSFSSRMEDFLTQNEISEEDRQSACTEKMFIIVPMTHKALLPDRDIHVCDRNVQRYSEQSLAEAAEVNGRKFGETYVYEVRNSGRCYRVAFEEATPLRTASKAAEEQSCINFDGDDFEAFAERFALKLNEILENKPVVGCQVELVKIYNLNELGSAVARHARALLDAGPGADQPPAVEPGADQPPAVWPELQPPASDARQPEESSELGSVSGP